MPTLKEWAVIDMKFMPLETEFTTRTSERDRKVSKPSFGRELFGADKFINFNYLKAF